MLFSSQVFTDLSCFQRAFFTQTTIDALDVQSAYNIARAAQVGFRNITVQFEVSILAN